MTDQNSIGTVPALANRKFVVSRQDVLDVATKDIPAGLIGNTDVGGKPVQFLIERLAWDYTRTEDGPWKRRWLTVSGPLLAEGGAVGRNVTSRPYRADQVAPWAAEIVAEYEAATGLQVVNAS